MKIFWLAANGRWTLDTASCPVILRRALIPSGILEVVEYGHYQISAVLPHHFRLA